MAEEGALAIGSDDHYARTVRQTGWNGDKVHQFVAAIGDPDTPAALVAVPLVGNTYSLAVRDVGLGTSNVGGTWFWQEMR